MINGTLVSGATTAQVAAGTTVRIVSGAPPVGQAFSSWSGGVALASPGSAFTSFVMPASDVTVTASFGISALDAAVHPRLWITAADLPRLRSWATASNPIYQQGHLPLLNGAVSVYNTQFFPAGAPNPTWPDPGDTQGYTGPQTEQYALLFAFHSLIDPSATNRMTYAKYARNLLMVAINQAAQGPAVNVAFRDPAFAIYNRANAAGECWPLVVDWIYNAKDAQGNPILTVADKAAVRAAFLYWADACMNASTTGGDHPAPVGVTNSTALAPNGDAYRMAANNYYAGHARILTLMSLALDSADDPPVNGALPVSALGNSLRSYLSNATGAWLYQQYTMFGEPQEIIARLGLAPNASVGLTSGGLPAEGMLYGHSTGFVLGEVLALKTAGVADPHLYGPQVALANDAPVWGRFMQGMAASLVPLAQVFPAQSWLGPVFHIASYGDILRLWITPDFVGPMTLMALLDQQNGNSSRLNAQRWWAINVVEGGAANLIARVQNPWSYGVQDAIFYYLLLDPNAAPPTDPRPGYTTAFWDALQGDLVEHSAWGPNSTMFSFRCSWITINHQQCDGNKFEMYRNGEWLTKSVANYDNNFIGQTSEYQNTLSLQNWCPSGTPANLGWYEGPMWQRGSQWALGANAGDPLATTDVQPGYTFASGDTTNLYNRPSFWTPSNAALDIQHASRSIFWLKPDHVVVYDRATSLHGNLFKHFNLALTANPSIGTTPAGPLVATTTPNGQHLYISGLLPATAVATSTPVGSELTTIAELEPTTCRLIVQDPTNPADVRFLHVLEGADSGKASPDAAALIQSTAGTPCDGAVIAMSGQSTVVMFKHDLYAPFTGVTFNEPSTVTRHLLSGLSPATGYTVARVSAGPTIQVTVTPGGGTQTDAGGVLSF